MAKKKWMPTEYEFHPPLTYSHVIENLPPGITLKKGYGDECGLSLTDSHEQGLDGGRLFVKGVRHRLMTDGASKAWLVETPSGALRVYVFGLQVRREDGGHGWWAKTFLDHFGPHVEAWNDTASDGLEIWDMCNASDESHPPTHGYCVSDLPGVEW